MLVKHQSDFPVRIRETIQDVTTRLKGEEPTVQIQGVYTKVRSFLLCKSDDESAEEESADAQWYGPDILCEEINKINEQSMKMKGNL